MFSVLLKYKLLYYLLAVKDYKYRWLLICIFQDIKKREALHCRSLHVLRPSHCPVCRNEQRISPTPICITHLNTFTSQ